MTKITSTPPGWDAISLDAWLPQMVERKTVVQEVKGLSPVVSNRKRKPQKAGMKVKDKSTHYPRCILLHVQLLS